MKNLTYILLGMSLGLFIGLTLSAVIPNGVSKEALQETVRAAVVINESRLEKRYFDLEERNTSLEKRIYRLESHK